MRIESRHAHAKTRYGQIGVQDYLNLALNCIETKLNNYLSINVHLPFEIQHPKFYPNIRSGLAFIRFGELLKKLLNVKLYWENAPEENYGKWNLKHGQTEWRNIPRDIDLCLDIGHASLDAKNIKDAKTNIEKIINKRGKQIKHLHLHANNFKYDQHTNNPKKVEKIFSRSWIDKIKHNRSYIYEKGE